MINIAELSEDSEDDNCKGMIRLLDKLAAIDGQFIEPRLVAISLLQELNIG